MSTKNNSNLNYLIVFKQQGCKTWTCVSSFATHNNDQHYGLQSNSNHIQLYIIDNQYILELVHVDGVIVARLLLLFCCWRFRIHYFVVVVVKIVLLLMFLSLLMLFYLLYHNWPFAVDRSVTQQRFAHVQERPRGFDALQHHLVVNLYLNK